MTDGSTIGNPPNLEELEVRKTSAYLIYERCEDGHDRLRGIFPDTHEGVQTAIAFGEKEFETFSVAEPGDEDGYLTKRHGITTPERHFI